ncbi:MAG: hypoxanthine phosphoribosyltransferase [Desulfocurvibacter africanus]
MPTFIKLIDEQDIARRVQELGQEICRHYGDEPVIAVCVLKGAFLFFSDLVRAFPQQMDVRLDFVRLASYGDRTHGAEKVEFKKDMETNIEGKHVLVVEDILHPGLTVAAILEILEEHRPASLALCPLLDKPARRKAPVSAGYVGFEIEDKFVVGYGLDFAEQYRNLPAIHVLQE